MLEAVHELLEEIQRIQCLVCAHRRGADGADRPTPVRELMEELRIAPEECGRVVRRLSAEGLLRTVPDPEHPLPRAVILTPRGVQHLEEWRRGLARARAGAVHA